MNKKKSVKLSKKQQIILYLLYRFRFLHTRHIQQYLTHSYPTYTQKLVKKLLLQDYVFSYKETSLIGNTLPHVYCLTGKAAQILKQNTECDKLLLQQIYKDKKRSPRFRNHCLLLADIYFIIRKQIKAERKNIHFLTKADLLGYDYLPDPLPDAYVAIKKGERIQKRYFLILIDPKTPWSGINKLVVNHMSYYDENIWQTREDAPIPSVLFIVTDAILLRYIKKSLRKNVSESLLTSFPCYFTTIDVFKKNGLIEKAFFTYAPRDYATSS